jgi:hypothetical protein
MPVPNKPERFRIFTLIAAALLVLCALFPTVAQRILIELVLPIFGALLILHAAWRAGKMPFGLLIVAGLLEFLSVMIERFAMTGPSPRIQAVLATDLVLQGLAFASLVTAVVIWVKASRFTSTGSSR